MKNVLKFLLLILCFASYTLHAQGDLKLGPEAGINYSLFNLKEDNQNATNEQSIFGLKLGLVAEYRFVDMFGLQTGIFFDQSGSKGSILNGIKDVNNNIVNAEFRYDFNRLTLPLTAQVYFGDAQKLRVFLGGGPFVSFLLNGRRSYDAGDFKLPDNYESREKIDFTGEGIHRLDYGVGINLGIITSNGLFFKLSGAKGFAKNNLDNLSAIQWTQLHTGLSVGFLL